MVRVPDGGPATLNLRFQTLYRVTGNYSVENVRPSWFSLPTSRREDGVFILIRHLAPNSLQIQSFCVRRQTDKGEVGGSSPPRPTIQIISKHAVILTFPLFRDLPQKTVLSTVCQLYDCPDGTTLKSLISFCLRPTG